MLNIEQKATQTDRMTTLHFDPITLDLITFQRSRDSYVRSCSS